MDFIRYSFQILRRCYNLVTHDENNMHILQQSDDILHISVTPSLWSWNILIGIMAFGISAAYYNSDENSLYKMICLIGCLFLGLTFLDDWEDCVIHKTKRIVTLTRKSWLDKLMNTCADSRSLTLDFRSITAVHVLPSKLKNKYNVSFILHSGSTIPMSETSSGSKEKQMTIAKFIRQMLLLERVETLKESWRYSDEDLEEEYDEQIENLCSGIGRDFEPTESFQHFTDTSSNSSSIMDEELLADF